MIEVLAAVAIVTLIILAARLLINAANHLRISPFERQILAERKLAVAHARTVREQEILAHAARAARSYTGRE